MVELISEGDCSSQAAKRPPTRTMESYDIIISLVIGLPAFDCNLGNRLANFSLANFSLTATHEGHSPTETYIAAAQFFCVLIKHIQYH